MTVGDRDDDGLDRREPERERAGEVLDEDADEALERAVDRAMDRDRPLRLAVLVDVGQVETLGQHDQVDLDGGHLPLAPERVVDVDVDLRCVEGAVLGLHLVADVGCGERFADQLFGTFPERGIAERLVRLRREGEARLEADPASTPRGPRRAAPGSRPSAGPAGRTDVASSWMNCRTRVRPLSVPERSLRWSRPYSLKRSGRSRYERRRLR